MEMNIAIYSSDMKEFRGVARMGWVDRETNTIHFSSALPVGTKRGDVLIFPDEFVGLERHFFPDEFVGLERH